MKLSLDERLELFKEFGQYPLSYAIAVEPDFKRFEYEGLLAYWPGKNLNLIIGDPLAPSVTCNVKMYQKCKVKMYQKKKNLVNFPPK